MGLAEDNHLVLTQYLGQNRKPSKREYEKSKKHRIPAQWNPGQSQNWWVLGAGVRFAYGDFSELTQVRNRLLQEKTQIGTWGSEQHSPIYWGFHLVGRLSILKAMPAGQIQNGISLLINDQIRDLFKYCELALSPNKKEVLFCGMRGTGMSEFSSYELWWLYATYILGKNPPKEKYWARNPKEYAWLSVPFVEGILRQCTPKAEVDGIRSPTHFMEFGPNNKWVYTENDQHGSTVFRGGSGYLAGRQVVAPANYKVHKRGQGASSTVRTTFVNGLLSIIYSGPYNKFAGAKPIVFEGSVFLLTKHMIWDKNGLRNALNETPQTSVPVGGIINTTEENEGSFWKRVKEGLQSLFNHL